MGIIPTRELVMACTPRGNRSESEYKKHIDDLVRQYTQAAKLVRQQTPAGKKRSTDNRTTSKVKKIKVANVWLSLQRDGTFHTTVPMLPFAKRMPVRIEFCLDESLLNDLAVEKMADKAIRSVQQIANRSKSLHKKMQTLVARHLNALSEVRSFEKELAIEQIAPVTRESDIWKRISGPSIVVQFYPKMEVAMEWGADWDLEYALIIAVIDNGRKLQIDGCF
jgi:hypothetical protein